MRGQAPNLMRFLSSVETENVQGWRAEGMNKDWRVSGKQRDRDGRATPSLVCERAVPAVAG